MRHRRGKIARREVACLNMFACAVNSLEAMGAQELPEAALLLNRAAGGDGDAWGALLALH